MYLLNIKITIKKIYYYNFFFIYATNCLDTFSNNIFLYKIINNIKHF